MSLAYFTGFLVPTSGIQSHTTDRLLYVDHTVKRGKGKVFSYSLPSVGPGADPGVQAVSPQVT